MSPLILGLTKSQFLSLVLIIMLGTLFYVYKIRRKIVLPDDDGMTRLRPNLFVGIVGLMCCLPYLVFLIHTIYIKLAGVNAIGVGSRIFLCILFFPVFIYGYYHLRLFFYHRLEFNKDILIISDRYGKKTEMPWSNLIGVDQVFSLLMFQRYALKTNLYSYYVDVDMVGFKVFEEYLLEQNEGVGELLYWKLYNRPFDIM